MIVSFDELEPQWALDSVTSLDARLFGSQAWKRETMHHELIDPSRIYIGDIADASEAAGLMETVHNAAPGSRQMPVTVSPTLTMRGYAGMWHADHEAQIMSVGVDQRYRRQGIGGNLLDRLIRYACMYHVRRIRLEVRADNEAAQRLYRSKGFKNIGLLRHYYQPGDVDAIGMALDFEEPIIGFSSAKRNMEQEQ
ncbi:ribosomal protein S18-alanine N-acetyltransferase [Bifidobacterium sp. ESL0682]|uniref:ribosomal protein S18-alanine N-acetyltransferase n=1 Tax=Bifidobacterium sp. ESL0682 TaxID=2983212 RepID=UPI0023F8A150|nr:ribosomal protein S18-alanine N-acetyltransferase [Bifidobacterium sp. ESL0682]WEV41366.1 ribosomal protein S18-alanine N-acetyltransferase [Bifidobacterium sp. ESL0682]